MEFINSFDMEEYWKNYDKNISKISSAEENSQYVCNNVNMNDSVGKDDFFPNNNVPENWKWNELEEGIQDIRNSDLAKE